MARRRRVKSKGTEDYELHLSVGHYDATVSAGINHNAYSPHLAWNLDERDPVFEFGSDIHIKSTLIYPDERAGEQYELTFYTADAPSQNLSAVLKDLHKRDKNGVPQYREYRKKQVPVYSPPKGLGFLNKVRGEPHWTAWIRASGRFVNDTLTLLQRDGRFFVIVHVRKEERTHWILSVHLQTKDPAEDV